MPAVFPGPLGDRSAAARAGRDNLPRPANTLGARMPQMIRLGFANGVARITLDRPEALNAFAGDMREQLVAALDRVADSPEPRVLVITGAGRGFCAGGDVRHMAELA